MVLEAGMSVNFLIWLMHIEWDECIEPVSGIIIDHNQQIEYVTMIWLTNHQFMYSPMPDI